MFEEEDEEVVVNVQDNKDDEVNEESSPFEESIEEAAAAQPVEIVREEIVTVSEIPNAETFSEVSTRDYDSEDDLYKLVKAHSVQLSTLTDAVESLQAELKQLEGARTTTRKTIVSKRSSMKTKNNKAIAKKTKVKSKKTKKKT